MSTRLAITGLTMRCDLASCRRALVQSIQANLQAWREYQSAMVVMSLIAFTAVGMTLMLASIKPSVGLAAYQPAVLPNQVSGDLGGIQISVDGNLLQYSSYEKGPNACARPMTAQESLQAHCRLSSIGFRIDYPGAEFTAVHPDRDSGVDYPVMMVNAMAGQRYPPPGALEYRLQSALSNPDSKPWYMQYEQAPSAVTGMDYFQIKGLHPVDPRPAKYNAGYDDMFAYRDSQGTLQALILCRYRGGHPKYVYCSQNWSMESRGHAIALEARYDAKLLPQWQQIQTTVEALLLKNKAP